VGRCRPWRSGRGPAESLTILSARVADISLLPAPLARLGVPHLPDEYGPPHGHRVGLSLGGVTVGWVTPLLSQADHRLHHVEP
jgi:hypothetical protein